MSRVNTAVMLVELRNELFALAAFLDIVTYPGANLRLGGEESAGEPGQQFADERGAAFDFHFCFIQHAVVDFSIKMEQMPNLEPKDAHLKVEAVSIKLRNKTAFIDDETAESLVNADNRPRLNVPCIIRDFLLPFDFDVVVGVPELVYVDFCAVKVASVECGGLINVVEPPDQVVDCDAAHELVFNAGPKAAAS